MSAWSPHVAELLAQVTRQQRAAIPRLALAIIEGRGVESLLRGPDKVCNHWTYWRKAKPPVHSAGWVHQPRFRRALEGVTGELVTRTETDVVQQSVERIRARLRLHDRWADEVPLLAMEALDRLREVMLGEVQVHLVDSAGRSRGTQLEDPRWARAMVAAAKALNDRQARLYEQDKSRADKLLATKEHVAAAQAFLDVMALGVQSAGGEDGLGSDGEEWVHGEEVAELGLQDAPVGSVRLLSPYETRGRPPVARSSGAGGRG